MKQFTIKKQVIKDIIYDKIIEYRQTLITTVIMMIPVIYLLYILNVHHYILPSFLGNSVIFRLDIYYRYFAIIFAFMHFYELYYKKEKPSLSNCFLYLFIVMTIISTIFAHNQTIAIFGYPNRYEGLYTLLFYCFLYLNCQKLDDSYYVKKMTKVIISVSFIHLLFVILQLTGVFSKIIYMYKSGDAIGLTSNCNFLGSLMCMLSMLTIGGYLLKDNQERIFYLISFIISYITLLLANSTGPFISFIGTFIVYIIVLLIKKKQQWKKIFISLILIISLYPIVLYKNDNITPEITSHINYILDKMGIIDSNKENGNKILTTNQLGHGRMRIWKNTWQVIEKSPWIGYGPDNLGLVYEKSKNETKIADKAHNIYLHIISSSGIFALIGYLGFIIINIIKSLKSNNNFVIILCFSIIAYSIQGIFNINVNEVTPYFYIILGFMVSLNKQKLEGKDN